MLQYTFSAVNTAYASNSATNIFDSSMELWDFLLFAISAVILFAWIFSIMYILWWGVLLILSWGKDDKIKPAINSIRYALIWLIVIVLSIFIFPVIARLIWIDATRYSSPDRIFSEIKVLGDKILKSSWSNEIYIDNSSLNWEEVNSLPSNFSDL